MLVIRLWFLLFCSINETGDYLKRLWKKKNEREVLITGVTMTSALHMDFIIMIAPLDSSVLQTENSKYKDFLVIDIKASQIRPKVLLRFVLLPP